MMFGPPPDDPPKILRNKYLLPAGIEPATYTLEGQSIIDR
jgi:hypothetical protein